MSAMFDGKVALVTGAGSGIGRAAALIRLTKAAAVKYAPKGVRVNAVAPAVIPTPMTERAFFCDPALTRHLTALHPIGRFGTPDEVANAVIWLCSSNASFTTGHTLPVDGGFLVP